MAEAGVTWVPSSLTSVWVSAAACRDLGDGICFQNFPQFIVIHTIKGFGIVNKAEIDVFLEFSCFSMIQQMVVFSSSILFFNNFSLFLAFCSCFVNAIFSHLSKGSFEILFFTLFLPSHHHRVSGWAVSLGGTPDVSLFRSLFLGMWDSVVKTVSISGPKGYFSDCQCCWSQVGEGG